jgi:alpha-ketoglutarate-dependent taurine dioxygenase
MSKQDTPGFSIRQIRRKPNTTAVEALVDLSYFNRSPLPLVIKPAMGNVKLTDWARNSRTFIEARLLEAGAILFRNFGIRTSYDLEELVEGISGEAIEYRERSSPRSEVGGHVYTSTDYPKHLSIFPHNEHSYSRTFPLKLFFFCETEAERGGETPLANTRKIFQRISTQTRERFIKKGWMYVRNYNVGFGLSWQKVFRTTQKSAVEEYCRKSRIDYEWKEGDRLRTSQIRPAVAQHPKTGEIVWFNHATFFHLATLDPALQKVLLNNFKEENLPNQTYYGDGSPIEPSILEELREAYLQEMTSFPWQRGDVLLLDNLLTSHARAI